MSPGSIIHYGDNAFKESQCAPEYVLAKENGVLSVEDADQG